MYAWITDGSLLAVTNTHIHHTHEHMSIKDHPIFPEYLWSISTLPLSRFLTLGRSLRLPKHCKMAAHCKMKMKIMSRGMTEREGERAYIHVWIFLTLHLNFQDSLPLNLELTDWLDRLTSKPKGFLFPPLQHCPGTHCPAQLFTWMLDIQTQVFILAQRALCPGTHGSSPQLISHECEILATVMYISISLMNGDLP